jgi:hypothetical protein
LTLKCRLKVKSDKKDKNILTIKILIFSYLSNNEDATAKVFSARR